METSKLKVVLVDDNKAFLKVFTTIVAKEFNIEILGIASSAEEFFAIENYCFADIIFMDLRMPEVDGINLAKQALLNFSRLNIIAVTLHTDGVYLESLIKAGFRGCISKSNLFNELKNAIDAIMNGKFYFPKNILNSK